MDPLYELQHELIEQIINGIVENGYAVADNFLQPNEVDALLEEMKRQYQLGTFSPAGIGKDVTYLQTKEIRGDQIRWVDRDLLPENCLPFFHKTDQLILALNRQCFMGIKDSELHFALYPSGTFYKRHLDVFKQLKSRKISVICYLNKNWQEADGGQLRIYLPTDEGGATNIDVLPSAGRLVCFLSDSIEHEVLPARRDRLSLTGWFKDELAWV